MNSHKWQHISPYPVLKELEFHTLKHEKAEAWILTKKFYPFSVRNLWIK